MGSHVVGHGLAIAKTKRIKEMLKSENLEYRA